MTDTLITARATQTCKHVTVNSNDDVNRHDHLNKVIPQSAIAESRLDTASTEVKISWDRSSNFKSGIVNNNVENSVKRSNPLIIILQFFECVHFVYR